MSLRSIAGVGINRYIDKRKRETKAENVEENRMADADRTLIGIDPPADEIERIEAATDFLDGAAPAVILAWAIEQFQTRLTIATGFGAEGVALIDMAVKLN